jgi:hypothetical protein
VTVFYWIRKTRICISLDYKKKKKKFWRVERLKRYEGWRDFEGAVRMNFMFMEWTVCI